MLFRSGDWAGLKGNDQQWKAVVHNPLVSKFARNSKALTALVFLTALSGELDAVAPAKMKSDDFTRGIRSWTGCWATLQRVPAHGWATCATYGRAVFARVREEPRQVGHLVAEYFRESNDGAIRPSMSGERVTRICLRGMQLMTFLRQLQLTCVPRFCLPLLVILLCGAFFRR